MKIPGIIGGLGPETTADFYLKINHMAEEAMIENRPACLVWNIPLPYALERRLLLPQTGLEKYIPYLRSAAKLILKYLPLDYIVFFSFSLAKTYYLRLACAT